MPDEKANLRGLRTSLFVLVALGGYGVCLAGCLGWLGRWHWFLDLFSHFRTQYAAALLVIGLLLLLGRRRRTALVFVAFAVLNATAFLPLHFGSVDRAGDASTSSRVLLLNVNTRGGDPEKVARLIEQENPEYIVLLEISSRWSGLLETLGESYRGSRIESREDNFGIALFSRKPLLRCETIYIGKALVPSIHAVCDGGAGRFQLLATHPLPPAGAEYSRLRNEQLAELPDHLSPGVPTLLLGDLNTTPWNYHFRRLLDRAALLDSSRGRGARATWPTYSRILRIPIDHCLHSPDVAITGKRTASEVGSDHLPLVIDFAIEQLRSNAQSPSLNTAY